MKRRVTVTERFVYEVDIDELLIKLATWYYKDFHIQDVGRQVDTETPLVEIEDIPEHSAGGDTA